MEVLVPGVWYIHELVLCRDQCRLLVAQETLSAKNLGLSLHSSKEMAALECFKV